MHDPGCGAHPGQQRGAPAGRPPGQAVAQLVHGAEGDVRLSHLRIPGSVFGVSIIFREV